MKTGLGKMIRTVPGGERLLTTLRRRRDVQAASRPYSPDTWSPDTPLQDVFTDIFDQNLWRDGESISGAGSTLEYTENLRKALPGILARADARTLLDAPCGDYNWMRVVERPSGMRYIGADIVPALIDRNNERYRSPDTEFRVLDITADPLPDADVWMCRDVLFHLSYRQIDGALANFARSNIRYLLTTTHTRCKENVDVAPGGFRLLRLELPPFDFPPAEVYVEDWIPGHPPRQMGLWSREALLPALRARQEASRA